MKRLFAIGLMAVLTLVSCQKSDDGKEGKVVATIYDKTLYQSDLQSVLYDGISVNDSIVRTKAFIDNWIRRQLIIHLAETNLDKSELDFSKQIEDYRNSLIIYKYETMMIEQNLDTVVTQDDIAKYIEANAPVDIDDESVRYIILNMRKKELIDNMNNSIYNKAVKEKVFEIY